MVEIVARLRAACDGGGREAVLAGGAQARLEDVQVQLFRELYPEVLCHRAPRILRRRFLIGGPEDPFAFLLGRRQASPQVQEEQVQIAGRDRRLAEAGVCFRLDLIETELSAGAIAVQFVVQLRQSLRIGGIEFRKGAPPGSFRIAAVGETFLIVRERLAPMIPEPVIEDPTPEMA